MHQAAVDGLRRNERDTPERVHEADDAEYAVRERRHIEGSLANDQADDQPPDQGGNNKREKQGIAVIKRVAGEVCSANP